MKKSESLKSKLRNTDDATLAKLITTLATATGMSDERRNALIADIPRLRRLLESTDEAQLSSVISSMGVHSSAEVLKKLKDENE